MLETNRIDDLRRLYILYLKVPDDVGRTALRQALKGDIEDRGKGINEGGVIPTTVVEEGEDEDDKGKGKGKAVERTSAGSGALMLALRWVQNVLDTKDKFDMVLQEAFGGDKAVQTSINEVSISPILENNADDRHFNRSSMQIRGLLNIYRCSLMNI